ncbi:cytochrome-c oxidase, cbb3-type subunit I [Bradymonas sediminis]|uniref:cytochrome-c oxidase, cbb3-type subunit I n=1 Tax=Bradymonas sediminis TaxID=1548548 RepID=UPI0010D53E68|nr:cytochrome-c oxidase, cbb3-type subunit I [Bradymonas sediminis]TDP62683.1 cytochrome c oxidase cbb3-type subunit I/II [Bradymonas sediminis]
MSSSKQTAVGASPSAGKSAQIEIQYDDAISRNFVLATLFWGAIGMLVGVIIALQLAFPEANPALKYFTFGRLRPVHTNAVIFAFAGNGIFAAIYYSTQRLVKARMFSDLMSKLHFWGWQAVIVGAAVTLPLGYTQTKEYAEIEWPLDIALTVVWVIFAINFFLTLKNRRVKHLYVAIWFYIATIITVAMLHIVNNLVIPVGMFKSYSVFSGVQDAMIQWWYGHNAVAFVLTTPFLGLMYYFLPKAANRPVFSYKLSILHFWSLVFIYIWAGPHHLHYTSLPEWAATLGMVFSVALWMPSWGGMINGLLTLRGAWDKLRTDPILKFFVVAITFYGMATFEGPMMSVKAVNALTHYTDYTVAHVHSGALGWNGFMLFGMIYWLVPRLWQTELWSKRLANAHFWMGTLGILLYIIALYAASISQGLNWRAFDENGQLMYPVFMETVVTIIPMYWVRVLGGTLYLTGMIMCIVNVVMTMRAVEGKLEDPKAMVPETPAWRLTMKEKSGETLHRRFEGWPLVFSVLTFVAVAAGSVIEIVPMLLIRDTVPKIESVKPYTPLELEGRDMYIAEGCATCHTQQVRPMRHEIERYGEYSKPGEGVYEYPHLWGSKRTGPDLARLAGKYNNDWHYRHMENPRSTTPHSIMPPYPHMLTDELDLSQVQAKMRGLQKLGVPYSDAEIDRAVEDAQAQAAQMASQITVAKGNVEDRAIVALIAYLQRLGADVKQSTAAPAPAKKAEEPKEAAAAQDKAAEEADEAGEQAAAAPDAGAAEADADSDKADAQAPAKEDTPSEDSEEVTQ